VLSLKERIDLLENDLNADPPRISVYHDLPFAILRYDPQEEWILRREVRFLSTRLKGAGKRSPQFHWPNYYGKSSNPLKV